ncbi:MAG: hypothetical protein JST44_25645, partial [Cyanobacteria bacterium SZAS LIN-5]|nr:hypothetical protein [Cyanobacteria bacterium SZAS LIN-5]
NMGAQMGANMGASMMLQALNGVQSNADKKARLNQTEAIMLYKIVRDTADKVVDAYKNYKEKLVKLDRANAHLAKMQTMISEARLNQTPFQQIQAEGELMKYQGEVEDCQSQVARFRQSLVDLSGTEAVAKLDKQLEADKARIEEAGIANATPAASVADGTQVAPANGAVPN